MAEGYKVTLIENWTFLNARGNPVGGYRVSFTTNEGWEGFVEIPRERLDGDTTEKAILAEIEKLRQAYEL